MESKEKKIEELERTIVMQRLLLNAKELIIERQDRVNTPLVLEVIRLNIKLKNAASKEELRALQIAVDDVLLELKESNKNYNNKINFN